MACEKSGSTVTAQAIIKETMKYQLSDFPDMVPKTNDVEEQKVDAKEGIKDD